MSGYFLAAHASSTTVVPVLWRVRYNLGSRLLLFPSSNGLDQSFWARIVQERNLGIHVKDRSVDEKALKNAIEMATTSKKIHDSCSQMKSCIRGENSGEDIVKMLEMAHIFFQ